MKRMNIDYMSQNERDIEWMEKALSLAEKGKFSAHPNPQVGAVIVQDNRIVGQGYHRGVG
ncbi:MAG: riboflavin biosynthesis protein RibD, partial [Pseudomonadota bacterium]